MEGALLLDADSAWAGAINTVLVNKGVRVNKLRRAEDIWMVEHPSPQANFVGDSSAIHRRPISLAS